MPRKRGGARQGTPGALYANRSDLRSPKVPTPTLPIQAAGNQPYGAAAAQIEAQRAIPLPRAAPAQPPAGGPTLSGPPAGPMPGDLGPLDRPTERPDEHVMSGAPAGPGPGPTPFFGASSPLASYAALLNTQRLTADGERIRDLVNATLANQAAP